MEQLEPVDFPPRLNSHIVDNYNLCPRRSYWADFRRLMSPEESVDLCFGKAYADGHEAARTLWIKLGHSEIECFEAGVMAAVMSWGEFTNTHPRKNLFSLYMALNEYYKRWPLHKDELQPFWIAPNTPSVECSVSAVLPIQNPQTQEPLIWFVRYDWIGQDKHGGRYVVDDKTTSYVKDDWADQWRLSNQLLGYVWTEQENGAEVGALVRAAGIYTREIKIVDSDVIYFQDWELDSWHQSTCHTVAQMTVSWNHHLWPKVFGHACGAYGRKCPYWELCLTENPEAKAKAHFIHKPRTYDLE